MTWKYVMAKCSLRLRRRLSPPLCLRCFSVAAWLEASSESSFYHRGLCHSISLLPIWTWKCYERSQNINIVDIVPVNFDAVGVPSLRTAPWSWPGSGTSVPAGSVTSLSPSTAWWCSTSTLVWVLSVAPWWSATRAEMVLKTTFMAFFAKCRTVFKLMRSVALTAHFAVSSTLAARSVWTAVLVLFLPFHLKVLMASMVVGWRILHLTCGGWSLSPSFHVLSNIGVVPGTWRLLIISSI